uniref:Uncharacterized protein n=1 Tax=viral metagenome TaxID=1070528 RepID=A0A6H1ZV84_9ZZZZ
MTNILNDFLGMDIKEMKDVSEQVKEKQKEIAVAIVKLTEYPEWKILDEELLRMLKSIDKPCDFYAVNPDTAKYDSGMKRAVQIILNFIKTQQQIIEKYAKRDGRSSENES